MDFSKNIKTNIKQIYDFLTHEQEILYFAASLSFYTIFSIIPLSLMAISIVSSLPSFQAKLQDLKEMLFSYVVPTNTQMLSDWLDTFLSNTHKMGLMGFIYILITSLLFFRNYEFITSRMFNTKPRKIIDSLMLYWVMMTFFPLVIAALLYFNVRMTPIVQHTFFQFFLLTKVFPWAVVCL